MNNKKNRIKQRIQMLGAQGRKLQQEERSNRSKPRSERLSNELLSALLCGTGISLSTAG